MDWSFSRGAMKQPTELHHSINNFMKNQFCVTHPFTLLSLLSLAPLVPAQTNRPSGTIVSWGDRMLPYVEPGTRFTAIAAGEIHTVALKSNGAVVAWGLNRQGQATVPAAAQS